MRFLRMLSNSILGGGLMAAYLVILVLYLNPGLPLDPLQLAPLALPVALFYGVHATAIFYLLIVVRQLAAAELFSPGWLSMRILVWLGAMTTTAGSALMWLNLRAFGPVLEPEVAGRLWLAAVVLSAGATVCVAVALGAYSFGRRGGPLAVGVFGLATLGSLIAPVMIRGRGEEPLLGARRLTLGLMPDSGERPARVAMLLLDGASLDFISPIAADGRLPNFGRLLDRGAVMHLATIRPTQPGPVWTAVATGKLPFRNGVRSAATYAASDGPRIELLPDHCFAHGLVHLGVLDEEPQAAFAVRARPLWDILSGFGLPVGIVGWPLTHPAHPVRGFMVSDRFHQLADSSLALEEGFLYPAELLTDARAAAEAAPAVLAVPPVVLASATRGGAPQALNPLARDAMYERVSGALQAVGPARLTAIRFQALDIAGHHLLRYAEPRAFGDVSDEERRQYGRALEQYYAAVDAALGRLLASQAPDDLLLVVSGFGIEPLGIGKRLLERAMGNRDLSGTHETAPDGFLIAHGSAVARVRLTRASVLDIAPTVLYFLGLPVARDMDGYARTDIFTRAFTADRPITFIPSYDR